ncbi:MAG: signal recognition particle-docking protein FtsY [Anaerolineales bacterium]
MSENIWQEALRRTRRGPLGQLAGIFGATELDEDFWERLEAGLIQADVGVRPSLAIVQELQQDTREHGWFEAAEAREGLRQAIQRRLQASSEVEPHGQPHVILMVGVNGSGKTTSAARLTHRLKEQGHSVMLAAADTYRAAAVEQRASWAERLGVPIVRGPEGGDPGAVVFQACQQAANQNIGVVIADTSGRMHTHHNLMEELKKIHRVAGKAAEGGPHETLLVLDATTGQNALMQAESFLEAIPVTGAVLAKLDHSARGGVAVAISSELGLPLQYVGLGEGMEDLRPFDPEKYIEGLLAEA